MIDVTRSVRGEGRRGRGRGLCRSTSSSPARRQSLVDGTDTPALATLGAVGLPRDRGKQRVRTLEIVEVSAEQRRGLLHEARATTRSVVATLRPADNLDARSRIDTDEGATTVRTATVRLVDDHRGGELVVVVVVVLDDAVEGIIGDAGAVLHDGSAETANDIRDAIGHEHSLSMCFRRVSEND